MLEGLGNAAGAPQRQRQRARIEERHVGTLPQLRTRRMRTVADEGDSLTSRHS
jgi:hypothetical protein